MYNQQRVKRGDGDAGYVGKSSNDKYRSTRTRKPTGAATEVEIPLDRDTLMRFVAGRMEQLGLNLDQDVRQYKDIPTTPNALETYRIRRVVSPFEFYLELVVWPEELKYSTWFPEMQQFYSDPENRNKYSVVHDQPLEARCYVCRNYEDKMWHRVRVHQARKDQPICTFIVFYLDYCKFQEVTIRELRELDPKFAAYPANVFRCYLQDIVPATGKRTQFSQNACLYLKEYMKDKEFTGLVVNRSNCVISEDLPDFITDFGIVLVENIPGTRNPLPGACTLNAMMVDMDFAVATGVYASCNHIGDIEGYSPNFDQTEYEQLFRESLDEHERLSSNHQKLQDLRLSEPGTSSSAPTTSFSYVSSATSDFSKESTVAEVSSKSKTKRAQTIPEEIVQRLAHIRICFVMNPSCMVVHLRCREAELEAMQESIRQQVEDREWLTKARPGTLVACNILDVSPEGSRADRSMWCRGVISAVNNEGQYKILLVDYGNETQTHSQYLRSLPTYFHEIPSFAVRIHLDVEGIAPAGPAGWTLQASLDFRHYAFIWEDKGPVYCIYRPGHAKCYELEDYAQLIVYSHEDQEWIPSPQYRRQAKHGAINYLRDHPMVHSLFVSCGVEMKYEILIPNTSFWYFETIADILVEKKHAILKEGESDNSAYLHVDIMNAAESSKIDRHPSLPIGWVGNQEPASHGSGNRHAGTERHSGNSSGNKRINGNKGDAESQARVMWENEV